MTAPDQNHSIEFRLERIESALAHLQYDIDSLNSVMSAHYSRLQELDSRFVRLEHELHTFNEPTDRTDAEIERPPHY